MTVVHCPCCRDEVTVPAKASPRALVRCPLCLEEYRLSEALAELPPALIVVDGTVAEDEGALVGAGVAEADVGGGYPLAGGGFPAAGAFDSSAPADAAVAPSRPMRGKIRKKKEKSAVAEMLKVVVGGVVGLSMGLGVLWWVFGKDPLELGPKVSPYAPWAVPARFHGKPKPVANDKTVTGSGTDNSIAALPTPPQNKQPGKQPKKNQAKAPPASGGLQGFDDLLNPMPTPAPSDQLIGDLNPLGTNPTPPNSGGLELPALDPNPTPQPLPTPPEPVSVTPPQPAANANPLPTAEDFQKAVLASAAALTKVNDSTNQPPDVRKQLFTDMYLAAGEMGRTLSHLSPSDPDLYESVQTMQTFLTSLIASNKVAAMKSLTDLQMPQRKHDDGVFLVGVVKDFQAAGSMFECQVEAGKMATPTIIVCANNPQDFCMLGDELLILGRMIDQPAKNLPGYEGSAAKVVYYGYHLAVPKAKPE